MTKNQKRLFGVASLSFVGLEVFFGNIFNAISSLLGLPFRSFYVEHAFFNDHSYLAYLVIVAELVSVISLIYFNAKTISISKVLKSVIFVALITACVSLLFLLIINFSINNASLP